MLVRTIYRGVKQRIDIQLVRYTTTKKERESRFIKEREIQEEGWRDREVERVTKHNGPPTRVEQG